MFNKVKVDSANNGLMIRIIMLSYMQYISKHCDFIIEGTQTLPHVVIAILHLVKTKHSIGIACEATLPTFTCSASSNHKNIIHEVTINIAQHEYFVPRKLPAILFLIQYTVLIAFSN